MVVGYFGKLRLSRPLVAGRVMLLLILAATDSGYLLTLGGNAPIQVKIL